LKALIDRQLGFELDSSGDGSSSSSSSSGSSQEEAQHPTDEPQQRPEARARQQWGRQQQMHSRLVAIGYCKIQA